MASRSKSNKKSRAAQHRKIARQAKEIRRLNKEIRRLRADVVKARKSHKPRKSIRARLTRALRTRAKIERPEKAIRAKRIKRPAYAKVVKGGTRKLPKITIRRKRRRKVKRSKFTLRRYEGVGGEMIELFMPTSFYDWHKKLESLRDDPQFKAIRKEFPKLTYSVFGNYDGVLPSIDSLITRIQERYEERAAKMSYKQRKELFANVVMYGVKRDYKRPTHRKVDKTGRSR